MLNHAWGNDFGHEELGTGMRALGFEIARFAWSKGPPPPDVPIGHLFLWEEAAAQALLEPWVPFNALPQWQRIGFFVDPIEPWSDDELRHVSG